MSANAIPTTTAMPTESAQIDHSRLGSKQHTDGGWGLIPVQTRSARFSSYDVADFETVSGFEAEWKRTPVALLSSLLTAQPDGSPYEYTVTASGGTTVEWIDRSDARVGSVGTPEDRASANAWTTFDKALSITISGEEPSRVNIVRNSFGNAARAAHMVITAKKHSSGLVIIDNSGTADLSENLEIQIEEEANLTVVSVQEWNADAVHLASHFAEVGSNAHLKHVLVSLGGKVLRINPSVHLGGEGGDVELFGVYFADGGQHLEQQVFVDHDAPSTKSRVSYKGALQGEGARTVWVGDVLIRPSAPGTDSYEQNRNLLLTEGARADSIPNLEIETGDIFGAGHASTSGRFDDEQLFYLQARGIPEDEARRLVVRGFLSEIVQKIGFPELEARLQAAIEAELLASKAE
ncbi:Fe-S cluster assembly protein SufD [Parafrigoribacterium humi]|jgi:Fe-S cluster assembly protein SufD|uniref:Fe-S cluster assembly protein SufD n=1 Tax=Parafrigoribacterium humi TaxID=3144664 RepID=UPI00387E9460